MKKISFTFAAVGIAGAAVLLWWFFFKKPAIGVPYLNQNAREGNVTVENVRYTVKQFETVKVPAKGGQVEITNDGNEFYAVFTRRGKTEILFRVSTENWGVSTLPSFNPDYVAGTPDNL